MATEGLPLSTPLKQVRGEGITTEDKMAWCESEINILRDECRSLRLEVTRLSGLHRVRTD